MTIALVTEKQCTSVCTGGWATGHRCVLSTERGTHRGPHRDMGGAQWGREQWRFEERYTGDDGQVWLLWVRTDIVDPRGTWGCKIKFEELVR